MPVGVALPTNRSITHVGMRPGIRKSNAAAIWPAGCVRSTDTSIARTLAWGTDTEDARDRQNPHYR